jgi:biopolymer transport protein TolR
MSIATRNEGKKVNSNINVTPMVDVMLVLLIIFMVITPMLGDKITVDLPKVSAAVILDAANKEDAITVAVTRDLCSCVATRFHLPPISLPGS